MVQTTRFGWWLFWLAIVAGVIAIIVFMAQAADPGRMAKRMQTQLTQLRGLEFKRDVVIQEQSPAELRRFAESRLQRFSAPENEQLLRTLGLLASGETLTAPALSAHSKSSPAGRYDPYSARMMVVKAAGRLQSGAALDDMYARELYRALLDQHFDLKTYLGRGRRDSALNGDERLARQIVVEGESLYAAVLWRVKQEIGRIPDHLPLEQVFGRSIDADNLVHVWEDPRMRESLGSSRQLPRREPSSTPTLLSQLSRGMQRDGAVFADYVRDRGWDELTSLYTTSPPISTEQVLHPGKWFLGERPVRIQWPAFETSAALTDWELVEQDVFGELLLRTVFRVYRLSAMMGSAPAGWNGDRYAVFKRRDSDSGDMLLLLYTVWDSEADAAAFAEGYRLIVKEKYAEVPQPVRILEEGRRVVIVEGGEESSVDALMQFAQSAREIEDPAVKR